MVNLLMSVYSQSDGIDCLHAAVSQQLQTVVESLCQRGASLDARDSSNEPALWQALSLGAYEVADILVGLFIIIIVVVIFLIINVITFIVIIARIVCRANVTIRNTQRLILELLALQGQHIAPIRVKFDHRSSPAR